MKFQAFRKDGGSVFMGDVFDLTPADDGSVTVAGRVYEMSPSVPMIWEGDDECFLVALGKANRIRLSGTTDKLENKR